MNLGATMSLVEILSLLSSIHARNWTGSHNGHRTIENLTGGCGMRGPNDLWAQFQFTEAGDPGSRPRVLKAERGLAGGGTVMVNGTPCPGAHMAFHLHLLGPSPHVSVEIDFVLHVAPEDRYRFDADVTLL